MKTKCRYWSVDEEKFLQEEIEKGTPFETIAEMLGRKERAIISKMYRQTKYGFRKHKLKEGKDWVREIVSGYKTGKKAKKDANKTRQKVEKRPVRLPQVVNNKSVVNITGTSVIVTDFNELILDGNKVTILLK